MIKEPLNPSFRRSFPESILQYFPYRLIMSSVVPVLIILGKDSMPYGQVGCIDDAAIDLFLPITQYLNDNATLGVILLTIGNFLMDAQLILSLAWWFMRVDNFRFPVSLTAIGVGKMLIAALFQTREIPNTFVHSSPVPSLLNSETFRHDYFFNAQVGFMLFAMLQWFHMGNKKMGWASLGAFIYVCLMPLFLRQNYFMDIFTGIVTAHLIFRSLNRCETKLHQVMMAPYNFIRKKTR